MAPKGIGKAATPVLKVQKKRFSGDASGPSETEPSKPIKRVRFQVDQDLVTDSSSKISDSKPRSDSDDNESSSSSLSSRSASPETPDLEIPKEVCTTDPPLSPTNQGRHACPSIDPARDVPEADLSELDEDALKVQTEECSSRPEQISDDPRLLQSRKRVENAQAFYARADSAMESARKTNISPAGNMHMENIVRRALIRLRAARQNLREAETQIYDEARMLPPEKRIIIAKPRPGQGATESAGSSIEQERTAGSGDVASEMGLDHLDDESDTQGNVWCLGITGKSVKNQCCSDCEIFQKPPPPQIHADDPRDYFTDIPCRYRQQNEL